MWIRLSRTVNAATGHMTVGGVGGVGGTAAVGAVSGLKSARGAGMLGDAPALRGWGKLTLADIDTILQLVREKEFQSRFLGVKNAVGTKKSGVKKLKDPREARGGSPAQFARKVPQTPFEKGLSRCFHRPCQSLPRSLTLAEWTPPYKHRPPAVE